jgi:hypothetical protein
MEDCVLVVSLLTQFDEIVNSFWSIVGVKLYIDVAVVCLDAGVAFDFDSLCDQHVVFLAD